MGNRRCCCRRWRRWRGWRAEGRGKRRPRDCDPWAWGGLGGKENEHNVLYVTSEESAQQTQLRARRLGFGQSRLKVLAETNMERITGYIGRLRPMLAVVDSVQMIYNAGESVGTGERVAGAGIAARSWCIWRRRRGRRCAWWGM